jgi:hypothetical protein
MNLARRVAAEAVGTALLLAAVLFRWLRRKNPESAGTR